MKINKHHITQNTINLIFLPICFILIFLSFTHSHQGAYQANLAFIAGIVYIIISTVHHFLDKSLTSEIAFEYILLGSLVFLTVMVFVI